LREKVIAMSSTLILNRPDVERLLDGDALFEHIKQGFAALATAGPEYRGRRHPVALPASTDGSAGMVLAPGLIPGIPACTVKVNSKFPEHPPAIKGVVVLHSLEDGRIMAILDSGSVTLARTAVAGAVGADALARGDAETVAIVGCGVQGRAQLEWMTRIRSIRQAYLYDVKADVSRALADEAGSRLGIDVEVCTSPKEAAQRADIIVTATWASQPFLFAGDVRPGTHITTLGPDGPDEAELAADLLLDARFFADSTDLQVEMGAIGGVGLGPDAITAEIGEVLAGLKPGRQEGNEITVFGMVGLPFEDLATAWSLYNKAIANGIGTSLVMSY
jgi:ornithine cyclodeaminase/alanine dehydrogenase-like protein (mu-crystallin family)